MKKKKILNVIKKDENNKPCKTKIRFVYQKKVLKEKTVYGLEKGEVHNIMNILSRVHNVPIGEVNVEFD